MRIRAGGKESGDATSIAVATGMTVTPAIEDALCVIPSGSSADGWRLYVPLNETRQPISIFQDRAPGFIVDAAAVRRDDRKAGALIAERAIARGGGVRSIFGSPLVVVASVHEQSVPRRSAALGEWRTLMA